MLSSFLRPVSPRLNTPMIRGLVLAVGITLLSFAAAQQCTYEIEPNDTPAEATLVTGVGPDGVGNAPNARLGTICLAGDIASGDQDAFWWEVDELTAAHQWTANIQGVARQVNRLSLFRIEFADNGVEVTAANEIFTFASADGSPTDSRPFLIDPGRYLVGISVSGGSGQYVVNMTPVDLAYRANRLSTYENRGEFSNYGPVAGEFEQRFEIAEADAGFAWGLLLEGPVGSELTLELHGPDGPIGTPQRASNAPARLDGYGLEPGAYVARIIGASTATRLTLMKQGRLGDGQEREPNNSRANATQFPLGTDMKGRANDEDWFRTAVGPVDAEQSWDLIVEAQAAVEVRLYGPDDQELLRRSLTSGSISALHLAEGAYSIRLVRAREETDYRLSWQPSTPRPANYTEIEPNDTRITATDLGEQPEARGTLETEDTDYFRFQVADQAQLYRVQAVGQGITRVSVYSGGGTLIKEERGQGRIRLDDLLLLPGTQYFAVEGDGEYAVRVIPIGPAPAPEPPADMPAADEALSSAPAAPTEPEASDASQTGPPQVEQPVIVPPPPGLLEYEPNNDMSRAHRLQPGSVHVGRLSPRGDEDHYRFYLAADQLVRIELVPPEGPTSLSFDLSGEGRYRAIAGEEGQPVVMERWLLAGDHSLVVHGRPASDPPSGYYQLRLTLLGVLDLPVDLEPNGSWETASTMPAELSWNGRVGEGGDSDFYAFPVFSQETQASVLIETEASLTPRLRFENGSGQFTREDDGTYSVTLAAGQPTFMELQGSGHYRVEVSFGNEPDAAQLLPPRSRDAIEVALDTPTDELAAYWHEGQRVEATATVTNHTAEPQEVTLSAAANDARARVQLPEAVTLQPGESARVPVTLEVASGARDDVPLYLEVLANSGAGAASARNDFVLACEALPVNPFPYHSLPSGLLGKPDVLWSSFGATIHGESGEAGRDAALIDGRTTVSYGGRTASNHHPTFLLAGDKPVELVGTSLHPQAGASRVDQLRRFRIEVSLDGTNFESVFEGELLAAHIEQVFEFDAPVTARYARLVGLDNIAGGTGRAYVGEWKLYAQEPNLFSGLDIAEPALGGHVVWSQPRGGAILDPEARKGQIDVRQVDALTYVIGFHHARAALVDEIVWRESEAGMAATSERIETVMVEVSLTGGAGPWEPVAEWQLERDAAGVAKLELEEPLWARYLRFTAPKGEATYLYEPQELSVYEADVGVDGYLSVLSEWGNMTKGAVYELLVDSGAPVQVARNAGNHTRETATLLTSGVPANGAVSIGENEDWYKITVSGSQNHVELRLTGDPSIGYTYELTDSAGRHVAHEVNSMGDDQVLTFFAEPGDYFLKIEEPKRTVVFAWDTSGSVGPYIPITYSSLAAFARVVDGERESVQLLAYDSPTPNWLLPLWSSDPLRVQQAIQEYDRSGDSSNTEIALLTAVTALADREGTKAVLLITDAESSGAGLTPDLWRAIEEVRPRVFTFEISSGGSDYSQDMMQDYASINGGYYEMADGVGDFDAGFARASCMLRRPKGYEVEVTLGRVEPPGPGTLNVVLAQGATRAAVEVIFDASGSMGQVLPSGEQRIVAAKRALETLVGDVLPDETPFALRAFGHISPTSCETRLDVALGALDRDKALAAVRAIEPKLLSGTPIAASLAAVADDLSKAGGARQVILITDGEESCGGDPAEAVRQLRDGGPLTLAIVSLALEPDALAVFEALAEEVGASYVDVGSYEALSTAIAEALNPAYEVYDLEGNLVAQGRVGGEAVELPMGLYRVRVLSAPVEVFDNVRVPGDGSVTVNAGR